MSFGDFFVFSGHVNSAGTCMGTMEDDMRYTYPVSSVARDWFSTAAHNPNIPPHPTFSNSINHLSFEIDDYTSFNIHYNSAVSSQTSTWNQKVVITTINDDLFAWLTKQSAVLAAVPRIMSCSPVSAAGAPLLHVRVSFLTSSSAVTSTTNAMYFGTAATMSAVPASKTPFIITSTKALVVNIPSPSTADVPSNMPSPSTADVPSNKPSNQPTQPAANQEAGPSFVSHSDQLDNQSSQPTTVQAGGTPSDQPVSPTAANGPSHEISQNPPQPTVTQDVTAPVAAHSNNPLEGSSQQPAANQESDTPLIAPSDNPGNQPTQPTTNEAGVSSPVLSLGHASEADPGTQAARTSEPIVVVIGGITATALSPSIAPVESSPLNTGGHVVDTTVASQGQAIVNGQTLQVSTVAISPEPAVPVIGSSFAPVSSGAYAIAGQTLNPGGSAIEISGTTYSIQTSGGIVVNGETVPISTVAPQASLPPAPVVIGQLTATPIASDRYVVADQTLSRGGSGIEVSGTTYSLPPSASNAIINGQVAPISTLQPSPDSPATVVIGGVTARPESSGAYYLIADQTLSPGGSALDVSGVTYSLPSSGANVVINGATSLIAPTDIRTVSAVVFGSATAVPLLAGGYVVGSQVISPGGSAVEISGTVYSLPASGSSVVVDGKTTAIQVIAANDAVVTLGSQVYTAVAASAIPLVIASQTLILGGSDITVSGTIFSLPPDATGSIVVNGRTTALATAVSGGVGLSIGSQQLFFTPLNSGIVIASQTLYPGGPVITVKGETLSIPLHGTAVVIRSGATTITDGLGGYIWQGIAASTSGSAADTTSETGLVSRTAGLSGTSSRAGVTSTQAAVSTGTESASSARTSTSDAGGKQPASSYKSATIALVVCLFAVVLL
jgi:hypothetical protein